MRIPYAKLNRLLFSHPRNQRYQTHSTYDTYHMWYECERTFFWSHVRSVRQKLIEFLNKVITCYILRRHVGTYFWCENDAMARFGELPNCGSCISKVQFMVVARKTKTTKCFYLKSNGHRRCLLCNKVLVPKATNRHYDDCV